MLSLMFHSQFLSLTTGPCTLTSMAPGQFIDRIFPPPITTDEQPQDSPIGEFPDQGLSSRSSIKLGGSQKETIYRIAAEAITVVGNAELDVTTTITAKEIQISGNRGKVTATTVNASTIRLSGGGNLETATVTSNTSQPLTLEMLGSAQINVTAIEAPNGSIRISGNSESRCATVAVTDGSLRVLGNGKMIVLDVLDVRGTRVEGGEKIKAKKILTDPNTVFVRKKPTGTITEQSEPLTVPTPNNTTYPGTAATNKDKIAQPSNTQDKPPTAS